MFKSSCKMYLVLILLVVFPISTNANASPEGAKSFIKTVSSDAIKVVTSKDASDEEKELALVQLFKNSVDTNWIAKFVLGRYWRTATAEQKQKYTALHKQFLINSYVPKFKEYTNQKSITKKVSQETENEYLVETEIIQPDGISIKVDYKVRKNSNDEYLIYDVIAEGVSLITTQRSEFSSILSRKGVDYLIKKLEARV